MKETEYRLNKIEGDISILRDISNKHSETIQGLLMGYEKINNTISRIIDLQDWHIKKLKEVEMLSIKRFREIEPLAIISRHWKFISFMIITITAVSLSIHTSLKEVVGWVI